MVRDIIVDGAGQFGDAAEHTVSQSLDGNIAEEAFHRVQPRGRCGRDMHMKTRMLLKPSLQKNGPTYEDLSVTNTFELSATWRNISFVATANASYDPARLDIELRIGSGDIYVDNVIVSEVSTLKK